MIAGFEELQKFHKDNSELMAESFSAMSKGMQAISSELSSYSKKSFDEGSAAVEAVLSAGTLDKAFEAQTTFARSSYEGMVTEMTKIGDLYADMAKEASKLFTGAFAKSGTGK